MAEAQHALRRWGPSAVPRRLGRARQAHLAPDPRISNGIVGFLGDLSGADETGAEALTDSHRVIAPDVLGFGFGGKPAGHDYRIVEQASLLAGLLDAFEVRETAVLAHDCGDSVARELLARQQAAGLPFRLSRVCFLNGGLFPDTHRPIRYIPERQRERERWVDALSAPGVPLGVVNGSADPVSGGHMVDRFEQIVGGRYFVRPLEGIGHYPPVEAPAKVLEAYREFLGRIAAPG